MVPLPLRLATTLLLGALTGCEAAPPSFTGARMTFDRPRYRRSAADVALAGRFLPPAAARAAATGPAIVGPAVRGQVVGLDGGAEVPLEGALVATSDGRAGLSGPDGQFAIAGDLPADGGLVASREGYVASAVAGLTAGAEVSLHLRSRSGVSTAPAAVSEAPFLVTGRVVDPAGVPQPGVLLVLEDARGAFSAPVETAADGRFALTVFAPGRATEAGTLLAVGLGASAWLGARSGVVATSEAGEVGDVTVTAADTEVTVEVDARAVPGVPVRTELALVMADGASLALPARGGTHRVASLPGARYELRVEAEDVVAGTASALHRQVAPDAGRVVATLLAPPATELDPALVLNEALAWAAVPEARGYQVTLAAIGGAGFLWEGFSATPALPFSFQDALPDGPYGLTITAWDAPGMAPRAVAQAGPRALRLPDDSGDWRRASRRFRVDI